MATQPRPQAPRAAQWREVLSQDVCVTPRDTDFPRGSEGAVPEGREPQDAAVEGSLVLEEDAGVSDGTVN